MLEHVVGDDRRQEVVEHNPLVVEANLALNLSERQLRPVVGELVVEPQHQPLKLGNDHVLVVARIADDRAGLGCRVGSLGRAARHVVRGHRGAQRAASELVAEQELPAVGVQVRLVVGAAAVDAVEIEPRCAEVDQRIGIVLALEAAGGVERQIVVDELPEVGVQRGNPALLAIGSVLGHVLVGDHRRAELRQRRLGLRVIGSEIRGWQGAEHAPEPPVEELRAWCQREAAYACPVRCACHLSISLCRAQ